MCDIQLRLHQAARKHRRVGVEIVQRSFGGGWSAAYIRYTVYFEQCLCIRFLASNYCCPCQVISKLEPSVADISKSICAYKILPNIARILQMAVNDFPNRDAREICRQVCETCCYISTCFLFISSAMIFGSAHFNIGSVSNMACVGKN